MVKQKSNASNNPKIKSWSRNMGDISSIEKTDDTELCSGYSKSFRLVDLVSDCDSISLDSYICSRQHQYEENNTPNEPKKKPSNLNPSNESILITKYSQPMFKQISSTPQASTSRPCLNGSQQITDYDFTSEYILSGVTAYVEVRCELGDLSKVVGKHLCCLGATVTPTLTKKCTHIIFKNGKPGTYKKGLEMNIPIVSILWIEMCKKTKTKAQEDLFAVDPPKVKEESFIGWLTKQHKFKRRRRKLYSGPKDVLMLSKLGTLLNESVMQKSESLAMAVESPHKSAPPEARLSQLPYNSLNDFMVPKVKNRRPDTKGKPAMKYIVMSNIEDSLRDTLRAVLCSLGGAVCLDTAASSRVTHIICGCRKRTLNVLFGMARGAWILSPQWMLESLELGRWQSEEKYELTQYFPAVTISREKREIIGKDFRPNLFGHVGKIFVSPNSEPPQKQLTKLISITGGQVSSCLRQCKLLVGNYFLSSTHRRKMVQLSEKQILDCISDFKVLNLEVLENE